jgi:short-subunit dehydrogenase
MSKSIVVFGAGPGLGRAVARRYTQGGYEVVLVARSRQPLESFAQELTAAGATAQVVTADLADIDAIPALAAQIRTVVGDPDAFYYGAAANGFIPVLDLTPQRVKDLMTLGVYSLLALVQEFLPHMIEQGSGAILSAQGASALKGNPHIAGGLALAAQRNYLEALHAEVAEKGVYVGGLFIGAAIENTPFHARMEAAKAAGEPVPPMPTADPNLLADLLWDMHNTNGDAVGQYPA